MMDPEGAEKPGKRLNYGQECQDSAGFYEFLCVGNALQKEEMRYTIVKVS